MYIFVPMHTDLTKRPTYVHEYIVHFHIDAMNTTAAARIFNETYRKK